MIPTFLAPAWQSIAPALKNHLWQSTIFALAAALLALVLRRNRARERYWLWMAASLKFLLPFALLAGIGGHFAKPRAAAIAQPTVYFAVENFSEPFTASAAPLAPVAAPAHLINWPALLPVLCGVLWLAGFLAVLAVWCVRWRRVARSMRRAVPLTSGREFDKLRQIEEAAGLRGRSRIGLRLSADSMEPGVFGGIWSGIFGNARPVLAWPAGISERLDDAQLEAILAHEVCHVRRRDNLTAAIHMLVEAVFWFHPLVWWMGARLVEERERACDEEVLRRCNRPEVYAESILKVCEFCLESPLPCVSGVTGSDLKKRIVNILAGRIALKLGLGRKLLLLAAALLAVAAPILLGQAKAARRMTGLMLAPSSLSLHRFAEAVQSASNQPVATQALPDVGSTLPQDQTTGKPFTFDVVAIRPVKPGNQSRDARGMRYTDDGLQISNMPLSGMLLSAYGHRLQSVSGRILGLPDWARTEAFDVQAKVADSDIAAWSKLSHSARRPDQERRDLSLLLLLTEQFKLKTHSETKEEQIYALAVAKGGPKLKLSTSDEPPTLKMISPGHLSFIGDPMESIVEMCAQMLGRKVVDKTGLTGRYDYTLDWTGEGPTADAPGSEPDASEPPVFTVVQEQLGLKLEAQKGPVEYIVVDHAEKPEPMDGADMAHPVSPALVPAALVQEKAAPVAGSEGGAAAQAASTRTADVPAMTFDVAAIRPSPSDDNFMSPPHGTAENFSAHMATVESMIGFAYDIPTMLGMSVDPAHFFLPHASNLVGGPGWVTSDKYDLTAKADEATVAAWSKLPEKEQTEELRSMMRALLADRFHLTVRHETRVIPVWALVVVKGGPKFRPTTGPPTDLNDGSDPAKPYDSSKPYRGRWKQDYGMIQGQDVTIADFTQMLWSHRELDSRKILDRTGLTGKYDLTLKWASVDDPRETDGPSLFTAIQEQLGLKLESTKAPMDVLVIDHIERPSPN